MMERDLGRVLVLEKVPERGQGWDQVTVQEKVRVLVRR